MKSLISKLSSCRSNMFLGFGNPESNILIVGQECAIDRIEQPCRARVEIDENVQEWSEILCGRAPNGVRIFVEKPYEYWFTPREGYKYRHQGKNEVPFSHLKRSPRRNLKNGDRGLGSTWYNYSKVVENICGRPYQYDDGCAFFDDCFLTELSADCALNNAGTNGECTEKSIYERIAKLLNQPFFQNFKIVIVAAGRYDRKYGINYRKIFPKAKVLIITPQLSRMSNELKNKIIENGKNGLTGTYDLR